VLSGGNALRLLIHLYVAMKLLIGTPLDVLVDREHGLPVWYEPGLQAEAAEAWEELRLAGEEFGVKLMIFSDYRSFADQEGVFSREVITHADRAYLFAARPGHSEHQLGTVFDVAWPGIPLGSTNQRNAELYAWLETKAHLYGFVLSYPHKEADFWPYSNHWIPLVTEYIYEPWHIRFVGPELAKLIYEAGYLDPRSTILPQDFFSPWP
jgi:D-alanyl-D-alanine carboxypeptidase